MLSERLLEIALLGSEWVLYVLIGLSIVSIAVMFERALFFYRHHKIHKAFGSQIEDALRKGDIDKTEEMLNKTSGMLANVIRSGLLGAKKNRQAAQMMVHAGLVQMQQEMERHLSILGTLGNNAPFIGLFGTVLGIIQAFHDLSLDVKGGASAVMAGISEALIATAAGLFVAIPAVIAYNYFMRLSARVLASTQSITDTLIAFIPDGNGGDEK